MIFDNEPAMESMKCTTFKHTMCVLAQPVILHSPLLKTRANALPRGRYGQQ